MSDRPTDDVDERRMTDDELRERLALGRRYCGPPQVLIMAEELLELRALKDKHFLPDEGVEMCECCGRWFDEETNGNAMLRLQAELDKAEARLRAERIVRG